MGQLGCRASSSSRDALITPISFLSFITAANGQRNLAMMAATLANGGTNPVTKKKVVSPQTVAHVLPVMATAGLYDDSGIWFYNVGLPAKSGVGGGIIAIVPGKFGIAAFSPRLDQAGNSVRAQKAITDIVEKLNLNPYLVQKGF